MGDAFDTYLLAVDPYDMELDDLAALLELAEHQADGGAITMAMLVGLRRMIVNFVRRKDDAPLAEGEADAFVGHLKLRQLLQVLSALNAPDLVPPPSGSDS